MEKRKRYWLEWVILITLCLGFVSPNYAQYQMSVYGTRLIETLHLTTSQYSCLVTAPVIPGACLSLFFGMLLDKFGARYLGMFCLGASLLGTILRIWAGSYAAMLIAMIMIGTTAAFLNANVAKILRAWFAPEKISVLMGITFAACNLGITLGFGTTALFTTETAAFGCSTFLAAMPFILWVLFMHPSKSNLPDTAEDVSAPFKESIRAVVRSKSLWIVTLHIVLMNTVTMACSSFLPTAMVSRGVSESASGVFSMAYTLGGAVGCFLSPVINSKLGKPRLFLFCSAIIAALGIIFAWQLENGVLLAIALFVTGYFAMGFYPVLMSYPIRLPEIGTEYAGTAGGLVATVQLFSTVVVPTFILTPITGNNYKLLFLLLGCIYLCLCVACRFLPDVNGDRNAD